MAVTKPDLIKAMQKATDCHSIEKARYILNSILRKMDLENAVKLQRGKK